MKINGPKKQHNRKPKPIRFKSKSSRRKKHVRPPRRAPGASTQVRARVGPPGPQSPEAPEPHTKLPASLGAMRKVGPPGRRRVLLTRQDTTSPPSHPRPTVQSTRSGSQLWQMVPYSYLPRACAGRSRSFRRAPEVAGSRDPTSCGERGQQR